MTTQAGIVVLIVVAAAFLFGVGLGMSIVAGWYEKRITEWKRKEREAWLALAERQVPGRLTGAPVSGASPTRTERVNREPGG